MADQVRFGFVRTAEAAEICGIARRSFYRRARRLGLTRYKLPGTRGLWWKLEDVEKCATPTVETFADISGQVH